MLFPATAGTAVALGNNTFERNKREVWDMATGKKIGAIRGVSVRHGEEALSPDGRYYAAKPSSISAIGIVDVSGEKVLGQVPITATRLHYLGFSSPTRLVAIFDEVVQVWDLPDMVPAQTFSPEEPSHSDKYALSPGGRYLAVGTWGSDSQLQVYDLNEGTLAGKRAASDLGCEALAFSPDGRELAGLFNRAFDSELIVWDVATGRTLEHLDLRRSLADATTGGGFHYYGRPLEWFPDGKRWLVHGHVVIDREAGGVVWILPKDAGLFSKNPRGVIDQNRVVVVMPGGKSGRLMAYTLPEDQIARGAETARAGGLGIDVHLPPLTPAEILQAVHIPKSDARSTVPLRVQPGPGPKPTEGLLAEPLTLNNPGGRFAAARLIIGAQPAAVVSFSNFDGFGRIDSAQAARESAQERLRRLRGRRGARQPAEDKDQETPADRPAAAVLQRYDLASGQQTGSISVPFPSELVAISPSGDLAVMQIAGLGTRNEGKGRLDVWSFSDGGHVAAWRPYLQLDDRGGMETVDAIFVDEEHFITRNFWGQTVCWKLPECEALWIVERGGPPALSPDRSVVAFAETSVIRFMKPVTGEIVGQASLGGTVTALAWHRDGRRLAAITSSSGGESLVVLDVHRGTIESEMVMAEAGKSLEWCGEHGLLVDNRLYCDLEQQAVLWEYELPVGVHLPGTIDERHWYIAAYSAQDPTATLNAVELPGPHLEATLARMKPEDIVVRPGATVSLQVNIGGGPGGLSQEARKSLAERLGKADVRVADGQPVTISVSATQSSTGETRTFESFGFRPEGKVSKDVNVNKVECRVAVQYQGRTLWEQTSTLMNYEMFVSGVKPENLQSYLDERLWQQAADAVKNARVPKYVFRESTPTGLGKSQFLPGGLASAAK